MAWKPVSHNLEIVLALQMRTFVRRENNIQGAAAQCCLLGNPGEVGGSWVQTTQNQHIFEVLHFEVRSSATLSSPSLEVFAELDNLLA